MNRKTIALILIMAILVLAACGRDRESESETPTATTATETSDAEQNAEKTAEGEAPTEAKSPEDESAVAEQEASPLDGPESPLDGPDSPLVEPVAEPPALDAVTTAETGALIGRIMIANDNGERPVVNMIVALADVIRDDEGVARVAGYDAGAAARTASDELGRFALNELAPGTYAIILDAVITSVMLNDPSSGETILVDIEAGKVMDLGRLDYESLALPEYAQ